MPKLCNETFYSKVLQWVKNSASWFTWLHLLQMQFCMFHSFLKMRSISWNHKPHNPATENVIRLKENCSAKSVCFDRMWNWRWKIFWQVRNHILGCYKSVYWLMRRNKKMYKKYEKDTKTRKGHTPVGLCPEDSHQTTEPAGRWGPESSSLLWFSSWPSTRRSPAHTPSRRSLQAKQRNTTGWNSHMGIQIGQRS